VGSYSADGGNYTFTTLSKGTQVTWVGGNGSELFFYTLTATLYETSNVLVVFEIQEENGPSESGSWVVPLPIGDYLRMRPDKKPWCEEAEAVAEGAGFVAGLVGSFGGPLALAGAITPAGAVVAAGLLVGFGFGIYAAYNC
jgi:hypothetical protein